VYGRGAAFRTGSDGAVAAGGEASCACASDPTREQRAMKAARKAAAGETRDVNDVP
jgi:hypothetical protein